MSRTIKDLPFWLWQSERLGRPAPPNLAGPWRCPDGPSPWEVATWEAWEAQWPLDPAVRTQKARRRSQRVDRRIHEGRYRAYVRDRIRHGDYDSIEAPEHLTGYLWWW